MDRYIKNKTVESGYKENGFSDSYWEWLCFEVGLRGLYE